MVNIRIKAALVVVAEVGSGRPAGSPVLEWPTVALSSARCSSAARKWIVHPASTIQTSEGGQGVDKELSREEFWVAAGAVGDEETNEVVGMGIIDQWQVWGKCLRRHSWIREIGYTKFVFSLIQTLFAIN